MREHMKILRQKTVKKISFIGDVVHITKFYPKSNTDKNRLNVINYRVSGRVLKSFNKYRSKDQKLTQPR